MKLNVNNETSRLESVVVGLATKGKFGLNPKEKWCIENGIYPNWDFLKEQVKEFVTLLESRDVKVYRPKEIIGENVVQLYARDIGFVVDDKYIVANMRLGDRQKEVKSLDFLTSLIGKEKLIRPNNGIGVEGGDVILHGNYIFVGQSYRTNEEGYKFLKKTFPNKEVIPLFLDYSDDPKTNVLHLDCAFQPIGDGSAIIYDAGIKNPEALYDIFNKDNMIHITAEHRLKTFPSNLFTNIFSINPETIVSEKNYFWLNEELSKKGLEVIKIDYFDSAIQDGLFRCSTLPLYRGD